MKLITNLEYMLNTYDLDLGNGYWSTLSTIINRLQETEPEETILVAFREARFDCDGIFHLKGITRDGCYLYEFDNCIS